MDWGNIADWAGVAVNGVAIFAAAGIAVLVPHLERKAAAERERRARLDIVTTRHEPDGLKLEVQYRPEFNHAAIFAEVTLMEPQQAVLLGGRAVRPVAMLANGLSMRFEINGIAIRRIASIQLNRLDNEDALIGAVFIQAYAGAGVAAPPVKHAKVKVLIRDQTNHRLIEQVLEVSAIDGAYVLEPPNG